MANIKSQIKRIRQNEKRRFRNKSVRSEVKTYVKRFHQAVDAGDLEGAGAALRTATRALDDAASKGIIHKHSAANRKSAIVRRLNAARSP